MTSETKSESTNKISLALIIYDLKTEKQWEKYEKLCDRILARDKWFENYDKAIKAAEHAEDDEAKAKAQWDLTKRIRSEIVTSGVFDVESKTWRPKKVSAAYHSTTVRQALQQSEVPPERHENIIKKATELFSSEFRDFVLWGPLR